MKEQMIIAEDGAYYVISCEKCGAAERKHKSCCTRYGEAIHFNPEFKCHQCGFTAKVVYNSNNTFPSPPERRHFNEASGKRLCPEVPPSQVVHGNRVNTVREAVARVVVNEGVKAGKLTDIKGPRIEEDGRNSPEFIQKRIDVKVETIIAADKVLKQLQEEKTVQKNAKIMIVANFGVVEGTLKMEVDTADVAQRIAIGAAQMRNAHLAQLEKEIAGPIVVNNDYFITILNARVIPFSDPSHNLTFAVLNLFSDQIAGFTCGEFEPEIPPE